MPDKNATRNDRFPFDDGAGVGHSASTPAAPARPGEQAFPGVVDRRLGLDRRAINDAKNPFDAAGFERRRGPGRRLSDFSRSAEEGNLTKEQFLFLMAIDAFKKANTCAFPTWTDVLEVIRLLGYRKTMPMEMTLNSAEDWMEAPGAPSGVRPPRWADHTQRQKQRDAA
ncbi:MAG TPA: hypothetical protein VD971_14035 [Phycisphaerales bacterium]|nr:hypothetical protein [Phycisphaerales bacterium]